MPDFLPRMPRRDLLETALATVGAGCVLIALRAEQTPAQAEGQPKLAKADASYQDRPNGQQHCAICAHYLPPAACQVVQGEVSPNGWCDRFQPKT